MEYDLIRLFEHPLKFRSHIPSAIVTLGGNDSGRCEVVVEWRYTSSSSVGNGTLMLTWDVATLRTQFADIDDELVIVRTRDDDQATRVENTAIVVAVAVMAQVEPQTKFTRRSGYNTRHDYYLNDSRDEMIEVAGRWAEGLPGLFNEKKAQSDKNQNLRKRWVSVSVFHTTVRNRTEGLHP